MRHPRDENPKQAALRAAFAAPPPRRKTMFLAGLTPLPPARCGTSIRRRWTGTLFRMP